VPTSAEVTCTTDAPLDLSGEQDWSPFDAAALIGESLRFVSGEPEGNRFRVRYYKDLEQHLKARVWFGPETEGPPGHAHGGSVLPCWTKRWDWPPGR